MLKFVMILCNYYKMQGLGKKQLWMYRMNDDIRYNDCIDTRQPKTLVSNNPLSTQQVHLVETIIVCRRCKNKALRRWNTKDNTVTIICPTCDS